MSQYKILGAEGLKGEVTISGNKNASLSCIAATLLTDEKVVLSNIPNILDVKVLLKLIEEIGSKVEYKSSNEIEVQTSIKYLSFSKSLVESIRGSILLLGPLLARGERVIIAPPGGDVIGLRRLDSHFLGFNELGVSCSILDSGELMLSPPKRLRAANIFLDEASVTATENMIMACSLADGCSTIYNAACEPHVQDLCKLLNLMGAEIEGIGSNQLKIQGKEKLKGCSFSIGSDYMETGSFIGLAAATNSELLLKSVDTQFMTPIKRGFQKLGIEFEVGDKEIFIAKNQSRIISKTYSNVTNIIYDAPWPGFPSDLLSIITVTATQMEGSILIHEKMFESRLYFVDYLIKMGADIILCDPHRAIINGKSTLKACRVSCSDVRAGMALVVASLCTKGDCFIENIEQIERGYENLLGKLKAIGVIIDR